MHYFKQVIIFKKKFLSIQNLCNKMAPLEASTSTQCSFITQRKFILKFISTSLQSEKIGTMNWEFGKNHVISTKFFCLPSSTLLWMEFLSVMIEKSHMTDGDPITVSLESKEKVFIRLLRSWGCKKELNCRAIMITTSWLSANVN